ncbi:hypothetical protein AB0C21_21230 [Spirillospora sp. NPDC049024]
MRSEDDLLCEAADLNGWALRWLRHVVAATALAGFGGLPWPGGERAAMDGKRIPGRFAGYSY